MEDMYYIEKDLLGEKKEKTDYLPFGKEKKVDVKI